MGLVVVVLSAGLVALGTSAAGGQAEPATFGYTVVILPPSDDAAPDASTGEVNATDGVDAAAEATGLTLSAEGDVSPTQGDDLCRLATIELATGVVTPLPAAASPEACAGDLAFAPDGTLYGLLQGADEAADQVFPELVRFDTTTGAAVVVGNIGTSTQMLGGQSIVPFGGITFDGVGQLLVALVAPDADGADPACRRTGTIATCLYRIDDPADPAVTTFVGEMASIPSGEDGMLGSTLAATCETVYSTPMLTEPIDDTANLIVGTVLTSVDATSGASTQLGAYPDEFVSWGDGLDPADGFWGLGLDYPVQPDFSGSVLVLDPNGGTPVATAGAAISSPPETVIQGLEIAPFDCTPEPIGPEPTFTR